MDVTEEIKDRFAQSIRAGDAKEVKNCLSTFPGLANAELPGDYDLFYGTTPLFLSIRRGKCGACINCMLPIKSYCFLFSVSFNIIFTDLMMRLWWRF